LRFCFSLLAAAVLATAARAGEIDTAKLDEARSLVAEAAALEQAQARGRITSTYADGLREDIRKDLQKLLEAPELMAFAREALRALNAHDAAALAALRDKLVAMERSHGRAS
jgi:hypothetical protein